MVWFQRFFPVVMILWPVLTVVALPAKLRAGSAERGDVGARTASLTRLWVATAVALALHASVQMGLEASLPPRATGRVAWPVFIGVLGGLLVWFGFAAPLFSAAVRDGVSPAGAIRAASLVPRHHRTPVPGSAWLAGWIAFAACAGAVVWAIAQGCPSFLAAGLGFWLFSGPLAARMSLLEPEPLDPGGSRELIEAYERLRAFKAWSFFGLGLAGTAAFAAIAVAIAIRPDAGGWAGAITGTVIGIAGSVVGSIGGLRRAHVQSLRQQLAGRAQG